MVCIKSLLDALDAHSATTNRHRPKDDPSRLAQQQQQQANNNDDDEHPPPPAADSFDPIDFLNQHYHTEQQLTTALPALRTAISSRLSRLDESLSTTLRHQAALAPTLAKDVHHARLAVLQLVQRIHQVQSNASKSECAVLEITRDMKQLDHTKKHLQRTITALKRLHMLLHAAEQLRMAAMVTMDQPIPQYKAAAHLVDATRLLLGHFGGYMESVPKMRQVRDAVGVIKSQLWMGIINLFREVGGGGGEQQQQNHDTDDDPPSSMVQSTLADACLVIEALGPTSKEQFLSDFISDHLQEYELLYNPSPAAAVAAVTVSSSLSSLGTMKSSSGSDGVVSSGKSSFKKSPSDNIANNYSTESSKRTWWQDIAPNNSQCFKEGIAENDSNNNNNNDRNCSFKRRMQDQYELADDNDDDDDEGIVATRSCGSGNNNIDPSTLLHFSPHNKQFEIESVRSSKRRRDAEWQKQKVWMEKAREQLGAGGGGANKQMAKRAKRERGHPNTAASPQEENREAAAAMTQQKMMPDKATQEGNEWMERARQFEGQCETHKAKCEVLSSELDFTKTEVRRLQDANTKHAVALALLQSQLDQTIAERDSAIENAGLAEVAKEEAVKELLSEMKVECDDLKSRLKVQRMIEEEICKLLDVDIASVDFTKTNTRSADSMEVDDDRGAKISFLDVIKRRLNEYRSYVTMKDDAEKRLQGCVAELEKVKADYQSARESVEVKDRDMTELMKSVGDFQRFGQDREHELTNRLALAQSQVVECRETILALGYEKKSLEEALEAAKSECSTHEITIASLRKEISDSSLGSIQYESAVQLERDCLAKAEEKATEERAKRIAQAAKLNAQLQEHSKSEKQLRESMESMRRNMSEQIRLLNEENQNKDNEIQKCIEVIAGLEAHHLSLQQSLLEQKSVWEASKEEEIGRLKQEIDNLESRLMSEVQNLQNAGMANAAKVQELEAILRQSVLERKRMHNIIQELRGNVRVFARIRPFLPDDGEQAIDGKPQSVSHFGDEQVSVADPKNPNQRHEFTYDRVFAPSAGQEAVFDEVSEFVQSALDGYNVCLFSYGQTGSGKTHTMQGAGTGVMRGLIPRCLEQIGLHKIAEEKDGWEFFMEVSCLKIYNESLKDLLRVNVGQECKHKIKVGSDGRRTVTDLTVKVIDPNDRAAVDGILALAAKRRATGSTDMNATSSRSHLVFTLNMTAKHVERNQVVRGTLNLVDLAGSERLDRSNATGQRQKETVAINKSLSSLVDVVTAIGQKSSHVPFRNSKLTNLLQPALSGDGKTCMIVNLSPTEASVPETLCSLRFASKVNLCELGKAKRTIGELKTEISTQCNTTSVKSGAVSRSVKRKL